MKLRLVLIIMALLKINNNHGRTNLSVSMMHNCVVMLVVETRDLYRKILWNSGGICRKNNGDKNKLCGLTAGRKQK